MSKKIGPSVLTVKKVQKVQVCVITALKHKQKYAMAYDTYYLHLDFYPQKNYNTKTRRKTNLVP